MKWLVVALFATSGCRLEIVEGTAESARETGASSGGTSAGGASGGPTTSGGSSGGESSGGESSGGVASGGSSTGGVNGGSSTGGGVNGGSSSGGANGGSSSGGCETGKTECETTTTQGGTMVICTDTTQDVLNCGTCGNDCATSYATGSDCRFGFCACEEPLDQLCANIPSPSPPTCDCPAVGEACASPSFKRDVYPFLAQQTGAFGCSASGCHSGASPASGLAFLDQDDQMDAGMAYEALVGTNGGGGSGNAPFCDAGVPAGVPSIRCACQSLVLPGHIYASYLIDVLSADFPGGCNNRLAMPIDSYDNWLPLSACSLQVVEQWVASGAAQ